MKYYKITPPQYHRKALSCLVKGILLLGVAVFPQSVLADEMSECVSKMTRQADDSTTMGEIRQECKKQISATSSVENGMDSSVASERMKQDKKHVLQPFTLMSHKPNYILLGAYNSQGYNPEVYKSHLDDPGLNVDDVESQFQISIKSPLALNLFGMMDIYGAYTNRSFWQVYNSEESAPFRETNHEPEGWLQFDTNWEFFGFNNTVNSLGIVHQSNGRGGSLSRSWNRIYANFVVERGAFALALKPWYRIQEDIEDDDNPDLTDYLGHYEIRAAYKLNDHVFSAMSRNNLESGFEKGAVELSWSFPLGDYKYFKGYVQYFTGYGESLIDYDNYVNKIGIGISLTDWL